jgi:hypothetical protein
MSGIGDIISITHVLKRAYDLYKGCEAAPEEIYLAREHIHAVTLCLEGVHSDLLNNQRSFVHQTTDIAKTRQHELRLHVGRCDRAVGKMAELLKKFEGFKKKHVSHWDRFRWSIEGKKEIEQCKSDLVFSCSLLDMFLTRQSVGILWKVEAMVEALTQKWGRLEAFDLPMRPTGKLRPRTGSSVTRAIVVSVVLAKFCKVLRTYRRKKMGSDGKKQQRPGPHRPKPIGRKNSGFNTSKQRNKLLSSYAAKLAADPTPPPPYTLEAPNSKQRPRTPSPDFYFIPGGTAPSYIPCPGPIRRSSSMQRLMGSIAAQARKTKIVTAAEHFECWRVGVGNLPIFKTAPQFLQHKRGQMQLKKMGQLFRDAKSSDYRALTEKDSRVKLLLNHKNKKEKGKSTGRKWYFVSGRVIERDPGRTGMVVVEKVLVVLARR